MSAKALAAQVGVSLSAVYQWEAGDTKGLKPDNLLKVGKILGARLEWLVFGKPPIARGVAVEELRPEEREAYYQYQALTSEEDKALLRQVCGDPLLLDGLRAFAALTHGHKAAMLSAMRGLAQGELLAESLRLSGKS